MTRQELTWDEYGNPVIVEIEDNNVIDSDEYHTDFTFQTKWTNIKPMEETTNSKMKVMAYDIECDSSHGDFPLPIKDYTKLSREIYNNYMKIYQNYMKILAS
mgnify:CR=1 FL=1